ncbi:MAG: DEAD/DEAH box helicase, partial [Verrucomicrobiota bacterium]
ARTLLEPRVVPEALGDRPRALLAVLETQGASFFAQLSAALPNATTREVVDALWDLVWAGLVTNDTFQPLRALIAPRRMRNTTHNLIAQAAGRWSLVAAMVRPEPTPTEIAHARALALLERYGVVSREAVVLESVPGGFASLAPVFRALEDAGKIRRGHFVEGLSGAQFAHAGAVDRLRAARDGDDVIVLAAVDPANPYGALIPWPQDGDASAPRRVAGARVVLVQGAPVLYVERGSRRLRVFTDDEKLLQVAVEALRGSLGVGRRRPLRVDTVNGSPALKSALGTPLRRSGFRVEPNALVLDAGPLRASVDENRPRGGQG